MFKNKRVNNFNFGLKSHRISLKEKPKFGKKIQVMCCAQLQNQEFNNVTFFTIFLFFGQNEKKEIERSLALKLEGNFCAFNGKYVKTSNLEDIATDIRNHHNMVSRCI